MRFYSLFISIVLLIIINLPTFAQEHYLEEDKIARKENVDVHNLKEWFTKGNVHGVFRYYGMGTINHGELTDYYANALGGRLYFESANLFGFSIAVGGNYVFDVGSSDLAAPDPLAGYGARWERQLFDLENPENKKRMDRLEELFIRYHWRSSEITLGKQVINTPLFSEQDGRMKPTMGSGIWIDFNEFKKIKFNLGWIGNSSPRSTVEWYHVEDAIGIYGQGFNKDGQRSDYHGNLKSNGIFLVGLSDTHVKNLRIQLWNNLIQNIQNSLFLQVDYNHTRWIGGFQYLRQDPVKDGGNPDPQLTYYEPGQSANVFSGRAGYKIKHFETTLNATKGLSSGRFTYPREFGTVRLYTFTPRLRSEGFGNYHSLMARVKYFPLKDKSLSLTVDVGNMMVQDPRNSTEFNKYGLVSWDQFNFDASYAFKGFLDGLTLRFFYITTWAVDGIPEDPALVHNKVNYHNFNFVAQIAF